MASVYFIVFLATKEWIAAAVVAGLTAGLWFAFRMRGGMVARHQRAEVVRVRKNEKRARRTTKSVEHRLAILESPAGQRLGSYRGVIVYERFIQTPNGSGPLEGTVASVEAAGNIAVKGRATVTRMAVGGVLLGPLGAILSMGLKKNKVLDARELYLYIENPTFVSVIKCPSADGRRVRQFAALVNTGQLRSRVISQNLPTEIARARAQLEALAKKEVRDSGEQVRHQSARGD
ncbi:MAG: hypothetical protein ACYDCC_16170 [Actinomycetota bacterium]